MTDEKDIEIRELKAELKEERAKGVAKDAAFETYKTKITEKEDKIRRVVVKNAFASSPYAQSLRIPPDMAESYFGHNFKVENGQPIGYINENKINSRKNPGNTANFDEALEALVLNYSRKNDILPQGGGSQGAQGGSGGKMLSSDEIKNMSLSEYEAAKKKGLIPKIK